MKKKYYSWLFNSFYKLVYKLEIKYSKENNTYKSSLCHKLRGIMSHLKYELIKV